MAAFSWLWVLALCTRLQLHSMFASDVIQTKRTPTVYCFALVMPFGYEPALITEQAKRGLSTFGCDGYDIFSDDSFPFKDQIGHFTPLKGPLTSPIGGNFNSYLNAPVFAKAWRHIFTHGRYKAFDWIIKVDADAVLFPERIRSVLTPACKDDPCEAVAVATCGNIYPYPQRTHDMVPGPIEILSKAAVDRLAHGFSNCTVHVDFNIAEDWFLRRCIDFLGVPVRSMPIFVLDKQGFNVGSPLKDLIFKPFPIVCDAEHAAFHPFKSISQWLTCHDWALRGGVVPLSGVLITLRVIFWGVDHVTWILLILMCLGGSFYCHRRRNNMDSRTNEQRTITPTSTGQPPAE